MPLAVVVYGRLLRWAATTVTGTGGFSGRVRFEVQAPSSSRVV
jgi:hypothetical protein